MKSILLITLCLVSLLTFGQEQIATYQMEYFNPENTEFSVNASEPDDKQEFTYYVEIFSFDDMVKKTTLDIHSKDLEKFILSLEEAKQKFVEWNDVAIANGVSDLNKEMSIRTPQLECAFYYGAKWNFDFNVQPTFTFKQMADGQAVLIMRTQKLVSSSNQYIDSKGGAIVFSTVEEIDAFLDAFDPNLVKEHFAAKNNKESLFED